MKLKALLATVLILLPAAQGLSLDKQDITSSESKIDQVSIVKNSTYYLTEHTISKYTDHAAWRKSFEERLTGEMDLNEDFLITGSRVSGNDVIILHPDGELYLRESTRDWIDNVALYEKPDLSFAASSTPFIKKFESGDESEIGYSVDQKPKHLKQQLFDLNSDSTYEGLLSTPPRDGKSSVEAFELDGNRVWKFKTESSSRLLPYYLGNNRIWTTRKKSSYLLNSVNGEPLLTIDTKERLRNPVPLQNSFVYSNSTHLVWRDYSGEVTKTENVERKVESLSRHPERDLLFGFQGESLAAFDLEGKKVAEVEIDGIEGGIDFYSNGDLSVRTDRKVFRVGIERENREPVDGYFYGTGRPMLEAVSLNRTGFVGRSTELFQEESDRNLVEASRMPEPEGEKWYVDSRKKAVYAAALAARQNATLTFEEKNADRDLSDKGIEWFRNRFVDIFEPNHLAVADLDGKSGVLAAQMAVREGYMPVEAGNDPEELKDRIEKTFDRIGNNRKSVWEGRYVSLVDAPRKTKEDPVNGIFSDGKDGDSYFSDTFYGELDEDNRLEVAVGRYPGNVSMASTVFHRSVRRDKGEKAVVASEYLHKDWPVVLATLGGGMLDGKTAEEILEKEGYSTTHLVEHRAEPVTLLLNLVGAPEYLKGLDKTQSKLTSMSDRITESSAALVKNGLIIVKGLEFAEGTLLVYLEYEWDDYAGDFEVDVPEKLSIDEVEQFVYGLFPDKHPKLTEERLQSQLKTADVFYFSGVGNSEEWKLPSGSNQFEGAYSKRELKPGEIPEMKDAIVIDSSINGATQDAEMKQELFENGIANYLGFSSVSYHSYSSKIANNFLKYGDTSGKSFVEGVNGLRSSSVIYNPASAYRTGVRRKMSRSAVLYGNPETKKDPLPEDETRVSKSCSSGRCSLEVSFNPSPVREGDSYRFNATDYTLKPYRPILPLYRFTRHVPGKSTLVDVEKNQSYREERNVETQKLKLVSGSGKFRNVSVNYTEFPEKRSGIEFGDSISYVQAAQRVEGNVTEILESASARITYETPLSVDIRSENGTVHADLYSDRSRGSNLVYTLGSRTDSINLKVEGEKTVELGEVDRGVHSVEATLYTDELKSVDSETVRNLRDPEIFLSAPDIDAGAERTVNAVIENPNHIPIETSVEAEVSGNASLGLMEENSRKISLEPESSRPVSWRLLGVSKGSANLSVNGKSKSFMVESGRDSRMSVSSGSFFRGFSSRNAVIRRTGNSSSTRFLVKNRDGRLTIDRGFEWTNYSLETDEYRSELKVSPRKRVFRALNRNGSYTSVITDGVRRKRSDGIDQSEASDLRNELVSEVRKFERFTSDTPVETEVLQRK